MYTKQTGATTVTEQNDAADPADYYTKPLELWTLNDYRDALGTHGMAAVLNTSRPNVRLMIYRNTISLTRMRQLQDAIRADEQKHRATLVTARATGAHHRTH